MHKSIVLIKILLCILTLVTVQTYMTALNTQGVFSKNVYTYENLKCLQNQGYLDQYIVEIACKIIQEPNKGVQCVSAVEAQAVKQFQIKPTLKIMHYFMINDKSYSFYAKEILKYVEKFQYKFLWIEVPSFHLIASCEYYWNFYMAFKSRISKVIGVAVDLYAWKTVIGDFLDCPMFTNMPLLEIGKRDLNNCIPIAGFTSCNLFQYQDSINKLTICGLDADSQVFKVDKL